MCSRASCGGEELGTNLPGRGHECGAFQKSSVGGYHLIVLHPSFGAINRSVPIHVGWRVVSCPRQAWLLPVSMLVTEGRAPPPRSEHSLSAPRPGG